MRRIRSILTKIVWTFFLLFFADLVVQIGTGMAGHQIINEFEFHGTTLSFPIVFFAIMMTAAGIDHFAGEIQQRFGS